MKTKDYFIIAFSMIALPCWSQQDAELKIPKRFISRIEASVGLTLSNPCGSYFTVRPDMVIPKFGYALSLSTSHDFTPIVSVDVTLLYEAKNYNNLSDGLDQSLNLPETYNTLEENRLKYLTLSFLPNFKIGKSSKFFLGVGGYYSFLRGVEATQTVTYSGVVKYYSFTSSTNWLEDSDHGLILSLKYRHPLNEKYDVHVQLLNALGLYDITTNPLPLLVIKNNTYSLMIGITLKK